MSVSADRTLPLADRERLGELLAELEPRLINVALRFTRDPENARDVVQNAFERALRHGDRFRGDARVSTWLHRIVINEALMWLRSERRRQRLHGPVSATAGATIPDPGPGPADQLARRRRRARLRAGLARLSSEDRDVMVRCGLAEQSYAEYGRLTGCDPAAAKSRAFRARRRLSALLVES